jgi:hypothetical protein
MADAVPGGREHGIGCVAVEPPAVTSFRNVLAASTALRADRWRLSSPRAW